MKYWVKTGNEYITAPSGYCRDYRTNEIKRDDTCPRTSGPELGPTPYQFESRKYAEQQAAKVSNAKIIRVDNVSFHPPRPGMPGNGYWECLLDSPAIQRECISYSPSDDGWCGNLNGDECKLCRGKHKANSDDTV